MTLLCSLLDSWEHLVMALGNTIITFRMVDVVSLLLFEDTQRKSSNSAKEALVVHGRSNERGKQNDKKYGKGRSKSHGKSKNPESPRKNFGTVIRLGTFVKAVKSLKRRRRPQILVQKNLKMMAMLSL